MSKERGISKGRGTGVRAVKENVVFASAQTKRKEDGAGQSSERQQCWHRGREKRKRITIRSWTECGISKKREMEVRAQGECSVSTEHGL